MIKYITILILSIPLFIQAQSSEIAPKKKEITEEKKTTIGFHTGFSAYSGFSNEISITQKFSKSQAVRFSFSSNFRNKYDITLGWRKRLLKLGRFELGTGLDLKYSHYKPYYYISSFGRNQVSFDLPIFINYKINDHLDLNMELTIPVKSIFTDKYYSSRNINYGGLKVGVGYRF